MNGIPNMNPLATLLLLLPGFLTAEIIGLLVLREDRKILDRLIQALLFTFLAHMLWTPLSWLFNSDPTNLLGLGVCAVIWGVVFTIIINLGWLHGILRKARLTQAASRPSEWYDAFYDKQEHTILHLHDGRRIFGWPLLYPSRPDKGHILLEGAEWLDRQGKTKQFRRVDVLVNVNDVRFVEFVPRKESKAKE